MQGNLGWAARVPQPGGGYSHAHAEPTVYQWGAVRAGKMTGLRLTGSPAEPSLPGLHLSSPAFLPTALLKELTASEEDYYSGAINWARLFSLDREGLDLEQRRLYTHFYRPMDLDNLGKVVCPVKCKTINLCFRSCIKYQEYCDKASLVPELQQTKVPLLVWKPRPKK